MSLVSRMGEDISEGELHFYMYHVREIDSVGVFFLPLPNGYGLGGSGKRPRSGSDYCPFCTSSILGL